VQTGECKTREGDRLCVEGEAEAVAGDLELDELVAVRADVARVVSEVELVGHGRSGRVSW